MTGNWCIITGASGGIGYEMARVFAAYGHNLLLIARNEERLKEVKSELEQYKHIEVKILVKDLSKPESPDHVFSYTTIQKMDVDILINNAGFADYGYFPDADWCKLRNMIDLNITSLTRMTQLYLQYMTKKGHGKILNVASTAAFQPGPLMAVYYAGKAYVLSFSRAVANEVKDKNVQVSTLCPGYTKTGFQERAGLEDSRLGERVSLFTTDAEYVARTAYKQLMKGKETIIPGFAHKAQVYASHITPGKVLTKLVRKIQEKRKP